MKLTDSQFQVSEDTITVLFHDRDPQAAEIGQQWDDAFNLPSRTVDQRTARFAALYTVAKTHNLVEGL